jgi:hypothetical protein
MKNNFNTISKLSFFSLMGLGLVVSYIPILSWPLDWVETFFHEISHGLMAIATGGDISRIELHLRGSGLCYTSGGTRFLVSFSGYAGAVLWGAVLYLIVGTANQWLTRLMVSLLGILVVCVALLWVRDLISFVILAVILGIITAAYAAGRYNMTQLLIRFIGLYVMLSAARTPLYLIDGRGVGDGQALSTLTGIPEIIWILIWEAIALSSLWLVYNSHKAERARTGESNPAAAMEIR